MKRVARFSYWRWGGPDQNGKPFGFDDLPDKIPAGICIREGWSHGTFFERGDLLSHFDAEYLDWDARLAAREFRHACRSPRQLAELTEVGYWAALYEDQPYGIWDALFQARWGQKPVSQLSVPYNQLSLLDEGVIEARAKTQNVEIKNNVL